MGNDAFGRMEGTGAGNRTFPKMDRASRAKQFMPFDALKGFREALLEQDCPGIPRKILSEDRKAELDTKLRQIHRKDIITAEYFKDGQYVQVTGEVAKVDERARGIQVAGRFIPFEDISDLQGEVFLS